MGERSVGSSVIFFWNIYADANRAISQDAAGPGGVSPRCTEWNG